MNTQMIRIRHPYARGAEIHPRDVWEFPQGLIGMPRHRRFALVDIPDAAPFRLLASLDDPEVGLVLVDPRAFVKDYALALPPDDLFPLEETDPAHLEVLVTVVLPTETTPLALNLKGPLVLSAGERRGIQRVSAAEEHALRWVPEHAGAGEPGCSS